MTQPVYLGIDVGGTKLAVGLVGTDGRVLALHKEPVAGASASELVDQAVRLAGLTVKAGGATAHLAGAGIGIPAEVDEAGVVRWCPNLPGLEGSPLTATLEASLGTKVVIGFDGHVGALAEQWVGAGRGTRDLVYVIVGTGIGVGIITGDHLVRGCTRLAGGLGWWVLDPAAVQYEERWPKGFLEGHSSGPALRERAGRQWPTPSAFLDAAAAGDREATRRVGSSLDLLGMALANLVSLVHPEVVVLGGGVGTRLGAWLPWLESIVQRFAQPTASRVARLVLAELGDETGVVGGARLAMTELDRHPVPDHSRRTGMNGGERHRVRS